MLAAMTLHFGMPQSTAQKPAFPGDYSKDLDELTNNLRSYGAFVRSDGIDVKVLNTHYRSWFASIPDREHLLSALEDLVGELHDFHASLGTNNNASPRLVPSGTDLYAVWKNGHAYIDQVQAGSIAEQAKITAGDEIVRIQDQPVRRGAAAWFGVRTPDERGWTWALNSALAGRWNVKRILTIRHAGTLKNIELETTRKVKRTPLLDMGMRPGRILYLRPEDSLGESALIAEFDKAVPWMRKASGIVLDLRNTPSGGTSSVARGIMGEFISHRLPYQRHKVEEFDTKTVRDWVEYATPRLENPVKAKVVVLVGRWTGSMGEGIAIGFDGMHRGTVVGTPMAGLRGAVDSLDLPVSGIRVNFPTEQVFHINGTPRHLWKPSVSIKFGSKDPWWDAALRILAK